MDTVFLDTSAVEELCAAIIRQAYVDLLKAVLFDEMVEHKRDSYNCYARYREFTREKKCRKYNKYLLIPRGSRLLRRM